MEGLSACKVCDSVPLLQRLSCNGACRTCGSCCLLARNVGLFASVLHQDVVYQHSSEMGALVFDSLWPSVSHCHVLLAPCVLPAPFPKKHLVFFDKLCVHQSDSKKKHAAIRSFAAFVGCSDRLLVLWSSAYFSRLWCTLEFATLVRKFCENGGKGRLPCDFQPLRLPLTVCATAAIATIWLWCVALSYVLLIEMDQAQSLGSKVLTALMALFGMPALMHALRSYTRERAELKTQLKNFDVECAECFSMEDREIILETIRHWFGSLPAFNTYVRTTVCAQLMISIGTRANFPFAMSLQAVLPMCFNGLDFVASARDEGLKVMATALLSQTGNILLVMIAISSCLRVASFGCIHVQRTSGACDVMVTLFASWVVGFFVVSLYTVKNVVIKQVGATGAGLAALICSALLVSMHCVRPRVSFPRV